jgi:hypothetical protein
LFHNHNWCVTEQVSKVRFLATQLTREHNGHCAPNRSIQFWPLADSEYRNEPGKINSRA